MTRPEPVFRPRAGSRTTVAFLRLDLPISHVVATRDDATPHLAPERLTTRGATPVP